jgi:alginate O-acetyltransferase complex protein AlgI
MWIQYPYHSVQDRNKVIISFVSFEFVFCIHATDIIIFWSSQRISANLALWCLAIASIVFYAYWNPRDVAIAGTSVVINFFVAKNILLRGSKSTFVFLCAVSDNIIALGY